MSKIKKRMKKTIVALVTINCLVFLIFAFGNQHTDSNQKNLQTDNFNSNFLKTSANTPPVAIGEHPRNGYVNTPVQFSGTKSYDPDGSIVSYSWHFGDGGRSNEASPTHTYANLGTYYTVLVVYDNGGIPGRWDSYITISNRNPVAHISCPPSGLIGESIRFDGTDSYDPDGLPLVSWIWNFGDGSTGTGPIVQHIYSSIEIYTVRLDVVDNFGATHSTTVSISINPINTAPTADAGVSYESTEGAIVTLDASGSINPVEDPYYPLQYRWDFNNDETWDTVWDSNPTKEHTWYDDHSGIVKVEVSDGEFSDTDTAMVTINNVAPSVYAGPDLTINEVQSFSFSGSFTDPGADTWTYSWDFGDGSIAIGTLTPSHTYDDNDEYIVRLTVTDKDGGIGSDSLTVNVINVEPILTLSGPSSVNEGSLYTLSLSPTDPADETITQWVIDWGDGTVNTYEGNPSSVTHTYVDGPNTYYILATATDEDGTYTTFKSEMGFESGDFTNWIVQIPPGGSADIVTSHLGDLGTLYRPVEGNYFACLKTDGSGSKTKIKRTIFLKTGQIISGWYAFDVVGFYPPFNDAIKGLVYKDHPYIPFAWLFSETISTMGNYADGPWTKWSFEAPVDDEYTIEFEIENIVSSYGDSFLLLDGSVPGFPVDVINVRPAPNAGPDQIVYEGDFVSFSGIFSDPGLLDTHTIEWDFGDGTTVSDTLTPTHTYTEDRSMFDPYMVTLRVIDSDGAIGIDRLYVRVYNTPPTLTVSGASSVDEGSPYTLFLSAIDPGEDTITQWEVDWGDGSIISYPGTSSSVTYTYDDGRNVYPIKVTATDEDGSYSTVKIDMGFEKGDLSGWGVYVPPGGYASVETSHTGFWGTDYPPMDGSYFALLRTDGPGSYTTLYKDVYLYAGQSISGWAAFDTRDWGNDNDFASVEIQKKTFFYQTIATPWYADVSIVGSFGDGPWEEWIWTATTPGNYRIVYRVTNDNNNYGDSYALFDSKFLGVTVLNVAPTVDAGSDQTADEGEEVSFIGSFSDPGADTYTIEWDFGDNTDFEYGTLTPTHTYADNGEFTVTLTVTDDDGGVGTDTLVITVINGAPTVDAGPDQTADEGDLVSFSGSFTDHGADTFTIEWDFGDNTAFEYGTLTPTHTYADNGEYTVTLTVTDDDDCTGTDTLVITVNNVAPTAIPGPDQTVDEGSEVYFDGDFDDPGGDDTHEYQWDFGDGDTASGMLTPTHTYADNGEYTVTLTVTDDDGDIGTDTLVITVNNVAPTVETGPDLIVDEDTVYDYLWWSFTDSGILDTHTAVINWGDGTIEAGLVMETSGDGTVSGNHMYVLPGFYTVTITVTDKDGGVGFDTLIVEVLDITPPISTLVVQFPYSGEDPYYVSTATEFVLSAEDVEMLYGSGVVLLQYRIDGGAWIEYEGNEATFTVTVIGPHLIEYRSIDEAGNTEEIKSIEVVVNDSELTYEGAIEGTYSDPVDLVAYLEDIATGLPIPGKSIVFTIGTQTVTAETDLAGVASFTLILDQPGGVYTVYATFANDGEYLASEDEADFTIHKEYAYAEYTGDMVVPLDADFIYLRATVFDEDDGNWGDLTKICLTITIINSLTLELVYTSPLLEVEVTIVEGVGVATITIPNIYPEEAYIVHICIDPSENDYYWGDNLDRFTLIIYEPVGDFVTGGGWIIDSNGNKGNFGFNVKYKKNGLPKGQAIYVYREGIYVYIVKSNAWVGMAIISSENYSIFEAKCNVKQVNAETGEIVWEDGNYRLIIEVWDNSKDGKEDVIQIRVYDKIGLIYHEAGFDPYGNLMGGNIVIHIDEKK